MLPPGPAIRDDGALETEISAEGSFQSFQHLTWKFPGKRREGEKGPERSAGKEGGRRT